jgi:hypothetical protein
MVLMEEEVLLGSAAEVLLMEWYNSKISSLGTAPPYIEVRR